MSILIKGIPLGGYEISIMKDGERYRARVDGIWCEVEEIATTDTDSDTISRAKAIDAVAEAMRGLPVVCIDIAKEAIEQLPPAQPERIKGHWIEHDDGLTACECSVCHEKYALYEEDVFGRNFCPNCGAEMEATE